MKGGWGRRWEYWGRRVDGGKERGSINIHTQMVVMGSYIRKRGVGGGHGLAIRKTLRSTIVLKQKVLKELQLMSTDIPQLIGFEITL